MRFSDEKARALFMKYALPCAGTLVKRGTVKGSEARDLMEKASSGIEMPKGSEKIFKTALRECEKIARKSGKASIGTESVRKYFFFGHDDAVRKRYKKFRDFDPASCAVYPGKVKSAGDGKAVVETPMKASEFSTRLCPEIKKGDWVSVHRNFIAEKISPKLANSLWRRKRAKEMARARH